jgi:hypothetical protein
MPAQSRSKPAIRGAKTTKSGRRAPVKSTTDVPVMAIVVGGVLLAIFIGLLIYGAINSKSSTAPAVQGSTTAIPCDSLEHTQVHYHAGLQIVYHGTLHNIPGGIGINGSESAPTCYYWLHVHSANANTIHIESPAADTFTLGDFFKVWDAWAAANGQARVSLSSTQIATIPIATGDSVKYYIDLNDGKGPQLYEGDPTKILLKSHEVITIVIGPPDLAPSDGRFPQFAFSSGL